MPPPVRKENHPLQRDMFEDKNTILKRQSHRMNLSLDREEGNGTDLVAAIKIHLMFSNHNSDFFKTTLDLCFLRFFF